MCVLHICMCVLHISKNRVPSGTSIGSLASLASSEVVAVGGIGRIVAVDGGDKPGAGPIVGNWDRGPAGPAPFLCRVLPMVPIPMVPKVACAGRLRLLLCSSCAACTG